MKYLLILICAVTLNSGFCQKLYFNHSDRIRMSVTESELNAASKFGDFHELYRSNWVQEYIETSITLISDETSETVKGKNDILDTDFRRLLSQAKVGDEIKLWVKYVPKNNLKENPIREMEYLYKVAPETVAHFMNDENLLEDYLHENLTCQLTEEQLALIDLTRLKITISTDGKVINPILKTSTTNEELDQLILQTFINMPLWNPAKSIDGTPVENTIRFIISDREQGCPEF